MPASSPLLPARLSRPRRQTGASACIRWAFPGVALWACSPPRPKPVDSTPAPVADTASPGPSWDPDRSLADNCWSTIDPVGAGFPDYESLGVVPGSCSGTRHQTIDQIERVVFLGDSVTAGTPPTAADDVYRSVLSRALQERFGDALVIDDCSKFGARTDDYLPEQIPACFPEPEDRRTLVVATNGGNDLFAAATVVLEGGTEEEGLAVLERAVGHHREAMQWFRDHPEHFPGGVDIIMANVYEFTDTTGNLSACELADTFQIGGQVDSVVVATQYLNAEWAKVAVETGTDMLFMNENFCGHGFAKEDPTGPCYRGPGQALWFDPTCIHPSTEGHAAIARMFLDVIGP